MTKVFMKMKSGLKGYTVFGSGKSWLGKEYVQITNEKKKPHPNRHSFFFQQPVAFRTVFESIRLLRSCHSDTTSSLGCIHALTMQNNIHTSLTLRRS